MRAAVRLFQVEELEIVVEGVGDSLASKDSSSSASTRGLALWCCNGVSAQAESLDQSGLIEAPFISPPGRLESLHTQ